MDWMDYAELEPWGGAREDLRAGLVASITANANRNPKKSKSFKPEDFFPNLKPRSKKKAALSTPEEWDAFTAALTSGRNKE